MKALVTQRLDRLSRTLAELKQRVRSAIATELGQAIGTAIRDVLVVSLATHHGEYSDPPSRHWDDSRETDDWHPDPDDWDESRHRVVRRDKPDSPAVPAALAVAVGFQVSRWWLAQRGRFPGALSAGLVVAAVGLSGGAATRALLSVVAAAAEVLTASAVLQQRT